MDFEAELAAFAEIEQLAEQVPVETNHATPAAAAVREPAAAANGPAVPPAAGAASALPQGAAAASADALSGKKRKLPTADRDGAAKKAHTAAPSFIVSSGATTAAPAAAVPAEDSGAFSSVVEADLIALQQRQAATAAATAADASAAAASHSAAAADSVAAASASTGAAASQQQGGYITGRVYNGWLASLHPTTGEPMWVEATPEQIEAAAANEIIEAQQAAAEAAAAKKAAKKAAKLAAKQGIGGIPLASGGIASGAKAGASQEKHHLRTAAGQVWDDPTLQDWPESQWHTAAHSLASRRSWRHVHVRVFVDVRLLSILVYSFLVCVVRRSSFVLRRSWQ
jgi:hypothetical protein